jgi:hypothetical protein
VWRTSPSGVEKQSVQGIAYSLGARSGNTCIYSCTLHSWGDLGPISKETIFGLHDKLPSVVRSRIGSKQSRAEVEPSLSGVSKRQGRVTWTRSQE